MSNHFYHVMAFVRQYIARKTHNSYYWHRITNYLSHPQWRIQRGAQRTIAHLTCRFHFNFDYTNMKWMKVQWFKVRSKTAERLFPLLLVVLIRRRRTLSVQATAQKWSSASSSTICRVFTLFCSCCIGYVSQLWSTKCLPESRVQTTGN